MAQNTPTMPVRGHHTAPVFSTNGPELLRFFEELEFLFTDCRIVDEQLKKRYTVRYVDVATADLWTSRAEFEPPATYDVWKAEIVRLYANTNTDRKYTMSDLDLLIGEQNRLGIYTAEDLANYHRIFLTITSFLISRQRLTERERDQQFKRAFRDDLWNKIQRRLEILYPNHDLDTPYGMETIRTAAEYLLRGRAVPGPVAAPMPAAPAVPTIPAHTSPAYPNPTPVPYQTHAPILYPAAAPAPPNPGVPVKTEDLSLLIDKLVQTIDRLNNPNPGTGAPARTLRPRDCAMCGLPGHFIGECQDVERYIQEGKCRRNAEGKVVLPSGAFVPNIIRGRNLKERIDEWHRQNPDNIAAARLTANANTTGQMMLEVLQYGQIESTLTADERIEVLEREIMALRKRKEVFDGVEIPQRRPFSKPSAPKPSTSNSEPATTAEKTTSDKTPVADKEASSSGTSNSETRTTADKGKGKAVEPQPAPSTSNTTPAKPTQPAPPVHPFSGIPENRYTPPNTRNLGAADKNKSSEYRTVAPITDPAKSGALFERCLGSTVTVSVGELCSVAPEIRGKFREVVTPKRVTATTMIEEVENGAHIEELEALPFCQTIPKAIVTTDPYETYLKTLHHDEHPERLTVAKESRSIRSILMLVDARENVECIVDPGSQIVAMSEEVCHDLGIQYDPTIILNMQSANGAVDPSLGLARNVPCSIGPVTLYLQIHVIRNPAYDILLGRPFDVVTCSNVKTYANDDTIITITDPNTGAIVSIPTFPRGEHRRPSRSHENFLNSYANLSPDDTSVPHDSYNPVLSHLYLSASRLVTTLLPPNSLFTSVRSSNSKGLTIFNASIPLATHINSVPASDSTPTPTPSISYPSPITDSTPTFSYNSGLTTETTNNFVNAQQVKIKGVQTKKKYKPVAQKVRSIVAGTPENFYIKRQIIGDPLAEMPKLDPNPPPFSPTGRYTQERMEQLEREHPGFLTPDERRLMHDFMCKQNAGFAWTDAERGSFRQDFFPPIDIPVVPHTPWIQRNIPIPPGIYDEVCKMIKTKLAAGVYEPSNSSYRSRWFCTLKKNGKLRIVHSLEPLNKVTIRHSGVTPIPDHVAEQFAGRVCGAMLDLYVGYDERLIASSSRDLTTFQTPFGALRLVTLPMGWTNSVPIFHDDVTHILQPEIPEHTIPYIDDVAIKGPEHWYILPNGQPETIPENPGIRRAIWEFFQITNRIVQRMKYCGGTFSGHKISLCVERFKVLGHVCTPLGRIPEESRLSLLKNWGPCANISELRAFLGTVGVLRMFVRNFAHRAHHLVKLTRKAIPFEFQQEQIDAQRDIVKALEEAQPLVPIQYNSDNPVILAVDTSYIAVGFFLCQCESDNRKLRRYNRFGSITLNDRESRFSQPKLELYGLYRAVQQLRLYILGVRNLIVEVDARYIKGMLNNPDIQPSASINRWIAAIFMFHFELVHVKGVFHGPDGLSRRPRQPNDPDPDPNAENEFEDWVDRMHGFLHIIQPLRYANPPPPLLQILTNVQISSEEEDGNVPKLREPRLHNDDNAAPIDPNADKPDSTYDDVPRSPAALKEERRVDQVRQWLTDLQRPAGLTDSEYKTFIRYGTQFFLDRTRLWRRHPQGSHQLVVRPEARLEILRQAHDGLGHRRFFATRATLLERFWWPHVHADIVWFVRTCHICQIQQTDKVLIPPVVATPAPLFAKVYVDTMHMPASNGCTYIVQGRCSLVHWPEWRALRKENYKSIGEWIFQDIICRWGGLREIVTDNGKPFIKALAYLAKKYHINFIRISGYNSRANGLVERPHFDVRQALFKAVDGVERRWFNGTYPVFWSERVTVRKRMGCSPYYAATGTHPLLPFDITEATYLQPPPDSVLSTTDLIVRRAIALQKRKEDLAKLHSDVLAARKKAALRFEQEHVRTIRNYDFKKGSLVLMRNTKIEKSLNRKMRPRYIGPLIVISRNKGSAYIICELDGSVLHRPVAAFRLIPYFARRSIPFPTSAIDIDTKRLRELEETTLLDDDNLPDIDNYSEPNSDVSDSDNE